MTLIAACCKCVDCCCKTQFGWPHFGVIAAVAAALVGMTYFVTRNDRD